MVSNVRDRNIDSSRREDSRKGQVDRCEVINVRPHVAPYPDDKDFNTVDVQLIDRPRVNGKPLTIKYVKLNSLQRYHGRFQGEPWNARIGDMVYIYWLAEREALVLGLCTSVEQEPVCRSQADAHHQEYVFKLCPWEEPKTNDDKNYIEFPDPKHPECYKWWPKTRDSLWIFDCLEGHNTPSCCAQACNSLDDHQSSTCFKNFSELSPTTVDLPRRFKFLHHCGSFWYYDDDGTIEIASKLNAALKCHQTFYPSGRILLQNDVTGNFVDIKAADEVEIDAATIRLDGDVVITGSCTHGSCSCESEFASLDGKAGGQTLCGGTEEDEVLTLCGTSDASKGQVTIDADMECNGDLCTQIKAAIKAYCDTLYPAAGDLSSYALLACRAGDMLVWPMQTSPVGYGAPTVSTRSVGTRMVLWDGLTETTADYALGIDDGTLWFSVPELTNTFKWYTKTTEQMKLTGPDLYVVGDVNCASVTDHTPGYNGDALSELKNITNDTHGRISHKTLPAFARAKFTDPATGQETEGRNIGNMVSILTKAVQQLTEKLEAAEKKIVELEARL